MRTRDKFIKLTNSLSSSVSAWGRCGHEDKAEAVMLGAEVALLKLWHPCLGFAHNGFMGSEVQRLRRCQIQFAPDFVGFPGQHD